MQIDNYGNFIKVWNSLSDIEKELGITTGHVSEYLHHKGKRKSAGIMLNGEKFYCMYYADWILQNN